MEIMYGTPLPRPFSECFFAVLLCTGNMAAGPSLEWYCMTKPVVKLSLAAGSQETVTLTCVLLYKSI